MPTPHQTSPELAGESLRKKIGYQPVPGFEPRGLRIRLYPNAETIEKLETLQDDARRAWNFLVKQNEEALAARAAYAMRQGLVGPRPVRPNYVGRTPEESSAAKDAFHQSCRDWWKAVFETTADVEGCKPRTLKEWMSHLGCKQDYQLLRKVINWAYEEGDVRSIQPGAHMLMSLTKNYFSKTNPKNRKHRFRRRDDSMPLQVRSGDCFDLGAFGDRRGNPFYNCQVRFNGLKIKGRLPGKMPTGRILEGVSISREADGWWASIKQVLPIPIPPPAVPGSIMGLDTGLDFMVAMSDGRRISNARGKAYSERIAGRQAMKLPVGRLQQAAARHNRHVIYNEILKPLSTTEIIKVEKLPGHIGQMGGSTKTSSMRTVVRILQQRLGSRVREVDPRYTSQDCSQCGFRCKESWSYEHGRIGECPKCLYRADRDVNAARNIAARVPISLEG